MGVLGAGDTRLLRHELCWSMIERVEQQRGMTRWGIIRNQYVRRLLPTMQNGEVS